MVARNIGRLGFGHDYESVKLAGKRSLLKGVCGAAIRVEKGWHSGIIVTLFNQGSWLMRSIPSGQSIEDQSDPKEAS